eukprot:scaffold26_cov137-Skeletonema_menzelii.AAC.1
MASRKKARGKARKARKKAKVDDAGVVVSNAPAAVVSSIHVHGGNDEHEEAALGLGPLLSLSQLRLRKPNNASSFSTSLKCTHGWNPFECAHGHDCHKFIEAAWGVFQFQARVRVRLEWIASAFIAIGTELVLQYAKDSRHCFNTKAGLSDFDRFRVMVAKKQKSRIIAQKIKELKA